MLCCGAASATTTTSANLCGEGGAARNNMPCEIIRTFIAQPKFLPHYSDADKVFFDEDIIDDPSRCIKPLIVILFTHGKILKAIAIGNNEILHLDVVPQYISMPAQKFISMSPTMLRNKFLPIYRIRKRKWAKIPSIEQMQTEIDKLKD